MVPLFGQSLRATWQSSENKNLIKLQTPNLVQNLK